MDTKSRIAEEYFQDAIIPELEEFLIFACEKMFEAYITKSLKETKKHYIINQTLRREHESSIGEFDEALDLYMIDEYHCFFDMMLAKLTPKQKLCIELLYKEGYTEKRISKFMGISPQAVYRIHKSGIRNLRKELLV